MGVLQLLKRTAASVLTPDANYISLFWDSAAGTAAYKDEAGTVNSLVGTPTARQVISGTGLTGGGDLSADRTLNVAANADASIVANANDIQVGVLATDAQHGTRGGGTLHANATTSTAGFMAATDKASLDAFVSANIFVNVKDYGAIGDGSHDDLPNINAAITAVPSGTTLYFPRGTYKITGTITVPSGKSIRFLGGGDGKSTITTNHGTLNMVTVGDWNTRFDDISFDASVSRTGGYAIDGTALNGGFYVVKLFVNNCSFTNQFNGIGINGTLCYVSDCQWSQTVNFGIVFDGPNVNSMVHNCTMDGSSPNAVAHIEVKQAGSLLISNCDLIRGTSNLRINPTSPNGAFSVYCVNTFFDTSPGSSVKFMGTGNIQRVKFVSCWFSGSVTGCEFASTAATLPTAVDFVACDIFSNSAFGILLNGVQDISVSNCRIAGNATAGIRTNASAASVTKFNLQNNTIGPTAGIGANGIGVDIVSGTYGGYNITGNDVRGNTSNANITDAGTVATTDLKIVGDNLGHGLKGSIAALSAGVTSVAATDTKLLTGTVPANAVSIGQTFRITAGGLSTSTGTLIFRLHCGPLGTVGDPTVWTSATSAAQVANGHAMVQVLATIRTLGGAGTIVAEGFDVNSGATLFAMPTLAGALVTGAVATNAAWSLTLSVTSSAGTFTANVGVVEAL